MLGYFFFSGLRSFALLFTTTHYGLSKPVVSALTLVVRLGALAGVYLGGRIADRLPDRGWINARVLVPAVALLALPLVFVPGVITPSVGLAVPLLTLGTGQHTTGLRLESRQTRCARCGPGRGSIPDDAGARPRYRHVY